jgi:Ca2+-binding RTX toxin-like protein
LYRGSGSDQLIGGADDDVLAGGAGADTLDGGDGNDIASCKGARVGVTIDLTLQSQHGGDAEGDTYKDIEGIRGSGQADKLIGDCHFNILIGGGGNDTLINQRTAANLDENNDFLKDDEGKKIAPGTFDILKGGDGFDTYEINSNVDFYARFTGSGVVLDRDFEFSSAIVEDSA